MKITNTAKTRIDAYQSAGGYFPGLDPEETITVSEKVAEDMRIRFPFVAITKEEITPEVVEEEKVEIEKPIKKVIKKKKK